MIIALFVPQQLTARGWQFDRSNLQSQVHDKVPAYLDFNEMNSCITTTLHQGPIGSIGLVDI